MAANPASGTAPLDVTFDASGSTDIDGAIVAYSFDADGDGAPEAVGASSTFGYRYDDIGTYSATVTVTDDEGLSSTASTTVEAGGPTQVDVDVAIVNAWGSGYQAEVTVSTNGADPIDWDETFETSGTVQDLWNADWSQTANTVRIRGMSWNNTVVAGSPVEFGFVASGDGGNPPPPSPPSPALVASPSAGVAPLDVTFDASGSTDPDGTIVAYSFDVDSDGTAEATGASPMLSYRYDATGSYTATVVVTDNDGLTDATAVAVEVNEPGGAVDVAVTTTDSWPSGYCANVKVTSSSSTAVDWNVTFSVRGAVSQLWNAVWSQNGSEISAQGVSWNNLVSASQPVEFGFCASL